MNKLIRFLALTALIAALPAFGQTFTVQNLVVNGTSQLTGNLTGTAGVFTGQVSLGGSAGAEALRAVTTASAVNWLQVGGAVTGSGPVISAQGPDSNINVTVQAKGTGTTVVSAGGGTQFAVANTASAVNYVQATGGATGTSPQLSAQGSDANAGITYIAKGTSGHVFDTNGGTPQFIVSNTTGATRYLTVTGSNGGNPQITTNAGFIGLGVALAPSTTAGIVGTTLADNANAGSVGEFICAQVSNGGSPTGCATNSSTPVSLTSGTPANVTSVSLSAGDWDCRGAVYFNPGATTTLTLAGGWISTASATVPANGNASGAEYFTSSQIQAAQGAFGWPVGTLRVNVSSTTTVYLSSYAGFGTSTLAANGFIGCRRVR